VAVALSELFQDVARKYPAYVAGKKVDGGDSTHQLVTKEIPEALAAVIPTQGLYLVEGSCGKGNVTPAPWIAVFDAQVTKSATRGYYLVYLYSLDLQRLVLSLAFGVTDFEKQFGSGAQFRENIRKAADKLSPAIPSSTEGLHLGKLDLAATSTHKLHRAYEYANIAAIQYQLEELSGEQLTRDLTHMLDVYRQIVESPLTPDISALVEDSAEIDSNPSIEFLEFSPRNPKGKRSGRTGKKSRPQPKASLKTGNAGEEIVYFEEKERLAQAGRSDLADGVSWPARSGEYPGYDISSFETDGRPRLIEVKSSVGEISSVTVTSNEWHAARQNGDSYFLYFVSNVFKKNIRIEYLRNPANEVNNGNLELEISSYNLSLQK